MVKDRVRGAVQPQDERSASFDFKNIFAGGKIGLELSLSELDRKIIEEHMEIIGEKIEETSAKVDYRWKITQWLMGIAIALGTIGQVITWVI
jgi:hypothetical protein